MKPDTKEKVVKFNLNDSVFVKMERKGYEIWIDFYNNIFEKEPQKNNLEYYISKADKNGYVKFQMWEFMQIFGPEINLGTRSPFFTNVYFYERDLQDYS